MGTKTRKQGALLIQLQSEPWLLQTPCWREHNGYITDTYSGFQSLQMLSKETSCTRIDREETIGKGLQQKDGSDERKSTL